MLCLIRLVRRVVFSVLSLFIFTANAFIAFSLGWGVIATMVWLVRIALVALRLLPIYEIFDLRYDIVAYSVLIALSLLLIWFSYLKTHEDPFHCNRCICDTLGLEQALCNWSVFCARASSPILWIAFFSMFYLTRSLINPIMYSLRMPLHCILHRRSKNFAATKIELALKTFKKGSLCTVQKGAILWKCLITLSFCLCSLQRIIHS